MQKIVLASSNKKKIQEINELLVGIDLDIVPQSLFKIGEAKEPFDTFIENALTKARYASKRTNLPAIADDSGICVDSLDMRPGIKSARYAHDKATDQENIDKLLSALSGEKNRNAHYYCSIVFITHPEDPQPIICEGIWRGKIVETPRGNNGFGYDPIFIPDGLTKTFAELTKEEKNSISHRAIAVNKLISFLNELN